MKTLTIAAATSGVMLLAGCSGDGGSGGGPMSLHDIQNQLGCANAKPTTSLEPGEPKRDKRVKCGQVEIVTFTSDNRQKAYQHQVAQAYKLFKGSSILSGGGWAVMGPTGDVKDAQDKIGGSIVDLSKQ